MQKKIDWDNPPKMVHSDLDPKDLKGHHLKDEINQMIQIGKQAFEDFDPYKITDGFHTFGILYDYRMNYNALLFNEWSKSNLYQTHKSKLHYDGLKPFNREDFFIVSAMLPDGQISNHYNIKYWDLFQILETPKALFEFDNYTPADCLDRMKSLLKSQIL